MKKQHMAGEPRVAGTRASCLSRVAGEGPSDTGTYKPGGSDTDYLGEKAFQAKRTASL